MRELFNLFTAFFKIGLFTFGGGYTMLPMLERDVIKRYAWATTDEILDYFSISQCTPGIIAVNTAAFVGYKRKGVTGGIVAALGVVMPSLIIITLIAMLLSEYMEHEIVMHAFVGIRITVCALVINTIIKLAKASCKKVWQIVLAVLAFMITAFIQLNTIYLIVATIGGAALLHLIMNGRKGGKQ